MKIEATSSRDLIIAGGGVAGLALGVALARRGIATTVHEAGDYPRHRVCGEFLSGVRPELLGELGLSEVLGDAEQCQTTRWSSGGRTIFEATLPRPALGISRYRMDGRMVAEIEAHGGQVARHSRLAPETLRREGTVVTTGRPARRSGWIGLKAHLSDFDLGADLEIHFGERAYLGLSRIEDGKVNLCGLFHRQPGIRGRKQEQLEGYLRGAGFGSVAERMAGAVVDPASVVGVAQLVYGRREDPAGCLALGDAGAMIPPFTGNGMTMALEGAQLALDPLTAYAEGRVGWEAARREVARASAARFTRRLRVANLLHPALVYPGMRRALVILARFRMLPFRTLFALTH